MGSVTRTRNTRLGIKMGLASDKTNQAIGWALFKQRRPKPAAGRQFGDVLTLTRKAAQEQQNEGKVLTVFTYLNDAAFAQAIAAQDGISRGDHSEMVEFIAAQLASDGFDIIVCEIE